jgi:hypothetical protein
MTTRMSSMEIAIEGEMGMGERLFGKFVHFRVSYLV